MMIEIVFLAPFVLIAIYAFRAVQFLFLWGWEKWISIHSWTVMHRTEFQRSRDQRRRELCSRQQSLDEYRRNQDAERMREQRQRTLRGKLRRAFENLEGVTGFMSLAAVATECEDLTVLARREMFSEHLGFIVSQAESCLGTGVDSAVLRTFLASLTTACGLPDNQADAILSTAASRLQMTEKLHPRPSFAERMQEELGIHRQRLQAIEQLPNDSENLEQMLEAEHRRHGEALMRLAAGDRSDASLVVTL